MVALMPSLVTRRSQRRFSAARMRTMLKCCARADRLPNQPSLEMFTSSSAPPVANLRTNEGNKLVWTDGRNHHALSGDEIADFRRNLVGESERPGNELAERDQVHLVV